MGLVSLFGELDQDFWRLGEVCMGENKARSQGSAYFGALGEGGRYGWWRERGGQAGRGYLENVRFWFVIDG